MKTFDRAMYAIFLLVLLADVARAQSLVSEATDGTEISGSVVLHAALSRASELQVSIDARELSSSPGRSALTFGPQFFPGSQATPKTIRPAHIGPTRNLFAGYNFAALTVVASLSDMQSDQATPGRAHPQSPAPAVTEHQGSPAP